jgi:hypothetical protein
MARQRSYPSSFDPSIGTAHPSASYKHYPKTGSPSSNGEYVMRFSRTWLRGYERRSRRSPETLSEPEFPRLWELGRNSGADHIDTPAPTTGKSQSQCEPHDRSTDFQVVLLIHGIRTQAEWQSMVKEKLSVPDRVIVYPIGYGYFDVVRFWFPFWSRKKPIERVHDEIRVALQKHQKLHPNAKLSIIAHSFGTFIIGEILKKDFTLQLHRLVLCGSVLPQDFPWSLLQGRFNDENTINECGTADIWPVLAQSLSWGYGASGTHGFKKVLIKDRFHAGGHGQYFNPEFVEKYWEPFIRRGEYKETDFEVKMPLTPWWVSVWGHRSVVSLGGLREC